MRYGESARWRVRVFLYPIEYCCTTIAQHRAVHTYDGGTMIQRGRLRQIREERGLSQRKLGRLIGKDGQYLWKLENGMRSGVTSTTLARLAVALGVSSDFLLGLDERPTRGPGTTPARRPAPVPYPVVPEGLTDGV
jgi:hypothetical protein